MEVKACSQSHFIAAIRGGEVTKVLSIARKEEGAKFRSIEEIYISHDPNRHDSLPKYPPKVNRSLAMPCGLDKVKTEGTTEYIDNELDFGGLTLRQLKDICKSHKRKASRYVNVTTIKQEDSDLPSEVDELDLKETLGSYKQKVLKKTKARKKAIFKCSSKSSTTSKLCSSSGNKTANLALLYLSSEVNKPLKIKVEDEEHNFSEPQAKSYIHEPEILTSAASSAFEHCCPDQVLNLTFGNHQSGVCDQFSHEHLEHPVFVTNPTCCLNQVSSEQMDNSYPQNPLIYKDVAIEKTIREDNSVDLSENSLDSNGLHVKREIDMTDLMTCDEPITASFNVNGSSFQIDPSLYKYPIQPISDGNAPSNEVDPSMILYNDCQDPELNSPSEMVMDDNRDIEVEITNATNFNSSAKVDSNIHSVYGTASLVKPSFVVEDKLLVHDVTTEGVAGCSVGPKRIYDDKCSEIGNDSTSNADIGRCAKSYNVAVQDIKSLPSIKDMESPHDVTSAIENSQSLVIDTSIATLACAPDIKPNISVDQPIGSAASEGLYKKEQQSPQRLLSARKTISPNSKEKLRSAMISAKMQDDTQIRFSEGLKATACRDELLEQNAVDTLPSTSNIKKARIILTSKRLQALRMTQTGPNSRQTLKKGKTENKLSDIKGTVDGSCVSSSSVPAVKACSSSASCSQNAIAFSQQQMVDIERLATKLLKELQTMKEMVVDTLHPESRTYSTSKMNTDKARVAVENAKRTEDATKKWLSMMARDCSRFCKIMELCEKKDASQKNNDEYLPDSELHQNNLKLETTLNEEQVSPKSSVPKERKIMFADEAGESLCHIKVL